MKKIIILALIIIVHCTLKIEDCAGQWIQQSVPVTSGQFFDMKFANATTGFILNWNNPVATFLRTTNAGNNWQILNNWGMAKISIVDTGCIYTSGYHNGKGVIYESTNLGISWDSVISSNTFYYNNLIFFNRDTGLISSGNSVDNQIWRTTNGGYNLQLIISYGGATSGKFFFLKEKVNGEYYGWMYYPTNTMIYRTTNSGLNWSQLPSYSEYINSVFFVNKDTGWATPYYERTYVYFTSNGGLNWVTKTMAYNSQNYDICFINPNTGWISFLSYQKIYKTTDRGVNWGTQLVSGNSSGLLSFTDSLTGWAQTSLNTISHTTDGGGPITSALPNNNLIIEDYKLYQNYPNPFNPQTTIEFSVIKSSNVSLKIFDITGREVIAVMNNLYLEAGEYKTHLDFGRSNLSSGVYFCRLEVKDARLNTLFVQSRRMIYNK